VQQKIEALQTELESILKQVPRLQKNRRKRICAFRPHPASDSDLIRPGIPI
jgi:hypothetical protein